MRTRASMMMAVAVAAITAFVASPVSAANVSWSSPVTIAGDTDVNTQGTLLQGAFFQNAAGATSSVNGQTFTRWVIPPWPNNPASATLGSSTAVTSGTTTGLFIVNRASEMSPGPASSLSANYQTMLQMPLTGINTAWSPINWSVTVGGLTPGRQYLFQGWVMDPDAGSNANRRLTQLIGGSGTSASINANTSTGSQNGGLGQYINGTFTADSTSQLIGISGGPYAILNAFQVRDLLAPTTPVSVTASSNLVGSNFPGDTLNWTQMSAGTATASDLAATYAPNAFGNGAWLSNAGDVANAWIQYDLGSTMDLGQAYLWQYSQTDLTSRGLKNFTIDGSVDGTTWNPLTSTALLLQQAVNGAPVSAQSFALTQNNTGIRYVRINADSSYGDNYVGLSEVRFVIVPEPGTLALAGLGIAAAACIRRRR